MRKLILWLLGAAIALLGLLAAGSWLIGILSRSTESYAEQQARIAQEAANADMWRSIVWIGVGLVFLFAIPLLVWAWLVALGPAHKRQMEKARFNRDYNVLAFDQLGNGPVIFDRENMQLISVEPGNAPYPAQFTFVNGAMPMQVKEPKRTNYEVPLVINSGGMKVAQLENYTVKELQPGQLPAADQFRRVQAERSEERSNGDFEAERSGPFRDRSGFWATFARCQAKGER